MKLSYCRLLFAFLISLMLTITPLPTTIAAIKPPWVLLLVLYLQLYWATSFNLLLVSGLGLLLDALLSTVLGQHVLALATVTWIASYRARRFRFFAVSQQMISIAVFCGFYEGVLQLIDAFLGFSPSSTILSTNFFLKLLFIMGLWPFLRWLLDDALIITKPNTSQYATDLPYKFIN